MQQRFLDAFPDIPEPLDADSGQRCVFLQGFNFLDTGQRLHLANSGTTSVHISDLQHSAAGTAANQETATWPTTAPWTTATPTIATAAKVTSAESELSTDTNRICNDSFGDLVHSADNPRAAVSTTTASPTNATSLRQV
jgi:hypothetical protein